MGLIKIIFILWPKHEAQCAFNFSYILLLKKVDIIIILYALFTIYALRKVRIQTLIDNDEMDTKHSLVSSSSKLLLSLSLILSSMSFIDPLEPEAMSITSSENENDRGRNPIGWWGCCWSRAAI